MADNVNQELIEKLKERLKWYYGEATEEEFDADEVDAICTLLDKLEPEEEEPEDMEAVYENLMARIREEEAEKENAENLLIGNEEALDKLKTWIQEEETDTEFADEAEKVVTDKEVGSENIAGLGKVRPFKKAKRGKSRKTKAGIRVAAILVIGVLGAGILSVNSYMKTSANKSLLTMILEEVGIVKVRKIGENREETGLNNEETMVYNSWSDLDSEIKNKIVVPGYIPEGFSLYDIKCLDLENRIMVWADYYNNTGGHLIFSITVWNDEKNIYSDRIIEDEGYELLSENSDDNTLYYYSENTKRYICVVLGENCYYKILSNVELDEMIKIREGIDNIK